MTPRAYAFAELEKMRKQFRSLVADEMIRTMHSCSNREVDEEAERRLQTAIMASVDPAEVK